MNVRTLVTLSVLVIAGIALGIRAHGGGNGFGASFGGSFLGSYAGASVANASSRNNGGGGCECNCRAMQKEIDRLQKQLDRCLDRQ